MLCSVRLAGRNSLFERATQDKTTKGETILPKESWTIAVRMRVAARVAWKAVAGPVYNRVWSLNGWKDENRQDAQNRQDNHFGFIAARSHRNLSLIIS